MLQFAAKNDMINKIFDRGAKNMSTATKNMRLFCGKGSSPKSRLPAFLVDSAGLQEKILQTVTFSEALSFPWLLAVTVCAVTAFYFIFYFWRFFQ